MEPETPTVAEVIRRAVQICDADGADEALGRLEQQYEDDDRPVTAVENLEEHLTWGAEGADVEAEDPAVAVALAIALELGSHPGRIDMRDEEELLRIAVRAQWHGDPPRAVTDWLDGRG